MTTSTGKLHQGISFGSTKNPVSLRNAAAICIGSGILIAAADTFVRIPLQLPGWRGLLVMAVIVAAHRSTGRQWTASAAAAIATLAGMAMGGSAQQGLMSYLVPGLIFDLLCVMLPSLQHRIAFAGAAAGLAHAAKFAVMMGLAGWGHRTIAGGALIVPLLSHFVFGLGGGLIAAFFLSRQQR